MSCAVKNCKNNKRFRAEGISFHLFPRTDDLQRLWISVLKLENWTWTRNKFVCSKHFIAGDFEVVHGKRHLKSSAVPSILLEPVPNVAHSVSQSTSKLNIQSSKGDISTEISQTDLSPTKSVLQSSSTSDSSARTSLKRLGSQHSTSGSDNSRKRRRISLIRNMHSYAITSPSKTKLENKGLKQKNLAVKKILYSARRRIKQLNLKITNLQSVIGFIKRNQYLSSSACEHLNKSIDSVPSLLMSRYLKNVNNKTTTHESYPPPLRSFAATLQFYSSKAYEEVRKTFALALPHQATIRRWYGSVDCKPGFIIPAFEALKCKVIEAKEQNREVICSIMLDEMAIKKQIDFDGENVFGYVDIGVPIDNDDLQPATEALVIMVVSHQSHWKIPIAYFLIKSLTGEEKANIVKECLIRLHDLDISVTSLTCDGPSAHFSMLKELGCEFNDIFPLKTWFKHPIIDSKVYAVLDVCHMLKLVRNNWASLVEIKDPEGNIVDFKFIKKLHEFQENETLHLANKIKQAHLEWYKQKMKVYLAAQTLSNSVADAIEALDKEFQIPQFSGSEATVNFIRKVDKLFDICNSKSPFGKSYKAPMRIGNQEIWRPFVMETTQ